MNECASWENFLKKEWESYPVKYKYLNSMSEVY